MFQRVPTARGGGGVEDEREVGGEYERGVDPPSRKGFFGDIPQEIFLIQDD